MDDEDEDEDEDALGSIASHGVRRHVDMLVPAPTSHPALGNSSRSSSRNLDLSTSTSASSGEDEGYTGEARTIRRRDAPPTSGIGNIADTGEGLVALSGPGAPEGVVEPKSSGRRPNLELNLWQKVDGELLLGQPMVALRRTEDEEGRAIDVPVTLLERWLASGSGRGGTPSRPRHSLQPIDPVCHAPDGLVHTEGNTSARAR